MKVIVVGCGRLGVELSVRLSQRGHEITVVDSMPSAFNNLPASFTGRFCEGDALNRDVLHRAGIETAEALAAVTNSDALNVVICHTANTLFKVPRVIARNYDPNFRSIYEDFGLQVISSTSWGAQRVEEMILHSKVHTVFSAGNGEVEIYEFSVPLKWDGKSIRELVTSKECMVVSMTRAGRSFIPTEDTRMQLGDIIHASATFEGVAALRHQLNGEKEA